MGEQTTRHGSLDAARRDLVIVLVALLLALVLADWLDINERFVTWAKGYELRTGIELEELPIVVSSVIWAVAWYAWRRWRQYRREVEDHRATDRRLRLTAEALAVSNARLRDAIEAIPAGFALFDAEDRFVLWNRRYLETYPESADLIVVGRPFEEMLRLGLERGDYPAARGREADWLAERMARHAQLHGSSEQRMWDGRWLRIEERRTAEGGSVGVRIDITELKRREAELQEARERADAASSAKSEFLANMSHELRTPLNAILGFSEIMARELMGSLGSSTYQGYAADIHKSGTHLLSIINDVLDLARVEAGKLTLRAQAIDGAEVLWEVRRMLTASARAAGVELEIRVDDQVPPMMADPDRLRQILLNLVSNAIKFTPPGGVVSAWLHFDAAHRRVVLEVHDTGIGIAPEDVETVLAAFGQVESALSRQHHGIGLGLPLAKRLAEAMGGSLRLASVSGVGTTVTLELPMAELAASAETEAAQPRAAVR